MPYFSRCDGLLAALDALNEVALMIVTLIEVYLIGSDSMTGECLFDFLEDL